MTQRHVGVRLLPWRPRRRGRDRDWDFDFPDVGLGDDPISAILFALVLILLLPVLLVMVLFSFEVALVLLLLPLLMTGQLLHLLPWTLVVHEPGGSRRHVQVHGLKAMLRTRRALLQTAA